MQTATVIGCGYVGLTTAVILANCGFSVRAVEIHPERLKSIRAGKSFFFEAGVDPLLQAGLSSGSLTVSDDLVSAVTGSDIVFSCVGTPDNPDGSSNLTYVFDVARKAAAHLTDQAVFVQKSTVPVGTGQRISELFTAAGKTNAYVSNPEFLREGTAIGDSLWFDRVVAGSSQPDASAAIVDIYKTIENHREEVAKAAGISQPRSTPDQPLYQVMSLASAELTKVTANAFLALKISFANSIAKLADAADADIVQVMDGVGADRRIGRAFLNAGRGYGGGCFPKDVSGLIRSAQDYGVGMEIMTAASNVNDSMVHYLIQRAAHAYGNSLFGVKVAVLGLSFKSGTSDVRRSPAIALASTLASRGTLVSAYDPQSNEEARAELKRGVKLCDSLEGALEGARCVFIGTDWPEFVQMDWQNTEAELIIDCMNCLDPAKIKPGVKYIGVGRHKASDNV